MSGSRLLPVMLLCLVLRGDGGSAAGGPGGVAVTRQPGSAPALIESIQQAGRQKNMAASLQLLEAAETLVPTSDVAAVDSRTRTALHWCVLSAQSASASKLCEAYRRLVESLLAAGADPNAEDDYGNTPLDYQRHPRAASIEDALIEQGGQPGYTLSAQARVLHLLEQVRSAERAHDFEQVRALLESDLPANSVLSIRLTTPLASHVSRAGDAVQAVVTAPLEAAGRIVVASGTRIEGTVLTARPVPSGFEQAQLEIDFCNLLDPGGAATPIAALLTDVDNSRERVLDGRIIGISLPQKISSRLSWGFSAVGFVHPMLGAALKAATLGWQKGLSREIILQPGTDMTVKVMAPEKLKGFPGGSLPIVETPPALADAITGFPVRATTTGNIPSDLVNVLFVGSEAQLARAFDAAGWSPAQKLSVTSGLKTFASLAQEKGYSEAPVSLLLLEGRKPDLVYQKQTNTFAKRHHIRIWRSAQSYGGRDLWLAAATHDIGIGVTGGGRNWIHRIEAQVDREQAKVKDDLMFTGRVEWFSLADRPGVPRRTTNGTGDEIRTQGRLLVLSLSGAPEP